MKWACTPLAEERFTQSSSALSCDDIEVAEKCLQNRVITVPGVAFGDEAKGFLRISFCNTKERMVEGVRRMNLALL